MQGAIKVVPGLEVAGAGKTLCSCQICGNIQEKKVCVCCKAQCAMLDNLSLKLSYGLNPLLQTAGACRFS